MAPQKHPNENDGEANDGSHWVPCSEHVRLRESYLTFRSIVYAVACIFASVAGYLWLRIDHFEQGAIERALAIAEIRKDLTYIAESQRRIEERLEATAKPQASLKLATPSAVATLPSGYTIP